ncbi:transcription coactivator isoform X2 [Tasmannia lanceolata]|uniref:transcription coactivator isoform X2 n=1 Tax=Tasmannia lanceolata TaxID=3420 RepID=UPI0040630420
MDDCGSTYHYPNKIFLGIRFVLFGFDSISQSQYHSELVNAGGIDVGRYDPSCTHVIVHNRVYDDPVCIAARGDGKTLVTDLWVEDSLDFGRLADPSRILYKPVKNLEGIPGSASLYICLTGYQKQERDDIMKMVDLMGAQFSKPLVASKVTHLICYKFEGEKYELAKKMKIKLVNHRWLEDCLKAWDILPIDKYNKSGWELEVMEAEARDSEEETEPVAGELSSSRMGTTPRSSKLTMPARDVSDIYQNTSAGKSSSHYIEDKIRLLSTHDKGLDLCDIDNGRLKEFDNQGTGVPDLAGATMDTSIDGYTLTPNKKISSLNNEVHKLYSDAKTYKRSPPSHTEEDEKFVTSLSRKTPRKSTVPMLPEEPIHLRSSPQGPLEECKVEGAFDSNRLSSGSRTTKRSPHSHTAGEKFGTLTFSRKTPRNSTVAMFPKRTSSHLHNSPQGHLQDQKIKAVFDTSALTFDQAQNNLTSGEIQTTRVSGDVHHEEGKSDTLPQKRKVGIPRTGLISPKTGNYSGIESSLRNKSPSNIGSPSYVKMADLPLNVEPSHTLNKPLSITETMIDMGEMAIDNKSKVETCTAEKSPDTSLGFLIEAELGIKDEDPSVLPSIETGEPQKSQKGGEASSPNSKNPEIKKSPNSKNPEIKKSQSTASASMLKDRNVKASSSTLRRKPVAKKNISQRSNLSIGNDSKHNGSIYSNKIVNASCTEKYEAGAVAKTTNVGKTQMVELVSKADVVIEEKVKGDQPSVNKTKSKARAADDVETSMDVEKEITPTENRDTDMSSKKQSILKDQTKSKTIAADDVETSMDVEKENKPIENGDTNMSSKKHSSRKNEVKSKSVSVHNKKVIGGTDGDGLQADKGSRVVNFEPVWFILSGHHLQRKEFQQVIRRLRGRLCRDSHHWSYRATHFIVPDPVKRTEKFFAAAAAGRWILNTDYLSASNQAGRFLAEEPFEWYKSGLSVDGAISLEAPRKWRLLRERTGHGALYGMRIIIYGECISPSLDTLKRVVKAGDGAILATSPPYNRFLKSGVDFAIISPGMPRVDCWVQEFLSHEIPCVGADYLVEYVCKPGYSLERHVLYNTHSWAEKSFSNLLCCSEEILEASMPSSKDDDDVECEICGSRDREELMLICGDEKGSSGCGVGMHIDCCDPPLVAVPEEDWFCPKCSRSRSTTPFKETRKSSSLKCK